MELVNRAVRTLLSSPAHGILSGSTDVVRYRGRRSGRTIETPTQYAPHGDGLVILVGRPDTKRWWRNFRTDRAVEVLVRGRWRPMIGRALRGTEDSEAMAPMLGDYVRRFPKTAKMLQSDDPRSVVVVWCRPQ